MSITYEEALATLEAMFGEPWNRDLLDSVLRNQKGHMENTCDLILLHGDKDPQILVDQLEAGIDPQQSAVAVDEALARQLSQGSARGASSTTAAAARSGKGKPTTLPDDFLRVPGFVAPPNSISDDEALARMLQDELFTEELRRNPDFAHLARGRSNATRPTRTASGSSSSSNPAAGISNAFNAFSSRFSQQQRTGSASSDGGVPQSPNVMEKVSALTDNAKRRLQMLAAQFNASNQASSPQHVSGAAASHERRGLLDDDGDDDNDNMELAARKDL